MNAASDGSLTQDASIKVFVRFRPVFSDEVDARYLLTDTSVRIPPDLKREYTFDGVRSAQLSQETIYLSTCSSFVEEVFNGYNCTLMLYGQTSSGKTHSLTGDISQVPFSPQAGMLPRLVQDLFRAASDKKQEKLVQIHASYVEIYREKICDLLSKMDDTTALKIREKKGLVYLDNCLTVELTSEIDALKVLRKGESKRHYAETMMNSHSSRSHALFMITVIQEDVKTGDRQISKLTLVDLAGSEQQEQTQATGSILEQSKYINKSLSALASVIQALSTKKTHVPYRDSKLTRLLSDSLGGNNKTVMILACSPAEASVPNTVQTLQFGQRAKHVMNKPVVNRVISIEEYKRMNEELKRELSEKDILLSKKEIMYERAMKLLKYHNIAMDTHDREESVTSEGPDSRSSPSPATSPQSSPSLIDRNNTHVIQLGPAGRSRRTFTVSLSAAPHSNVPKPEHPVSSVLPPIHPPPDVLDEDDVTLLTQVIQASPVVQMRKQRRSSISDIISGPEVWDDGTRFELQEVKFN